jgi:hypothetical protein
MSPLGWSRAYELVGRSGLAQRRRIVRGKPQAAELEQLELRQLLSGFPSSVFAEFRGTTSGASPTAVIPIHLNPGGFTLRGGRAMLGFEVQRTAGGLDPAAVMVRPAGGGAALPTRLSRANPIGASTGASLVLADIPTGDFEVVVGGEAASTGSYLVRISLVGDVNGDRAVNQQDIDLLAAAFGSASGQAGFVANGDADGDGSITSFDRSMQVRNNGDATSINPLDLTAAYSPAPTVTLPNGSGLLNTRTPRVVGTTNPGQVIGLDLDGDGFDDGSTTALASGQYSLQLSLAEGLTPVRVRVQDSFGQVTIKNLSLTVDTVPRWP